MTPEERDRLTRLETIVEGQKEQLEAIAKNVVQLVAAANMGKGAWWLILRIGGIGVLILGALGWAANLLLHK